MPLKHHVQINILFEHFLKLKLFSVYPKFLLHQILKLRIYLKLDSANSVQA